MVLFESSQAVKLNNADNEAANTLFLIQDHWPIDNKEEQWLTPPGVSRIDVS